VTFGSYQKGGILTTKLTRKMKDNLTKKVSDEAESPAFLVGAVMPSCLQLSLKNKWFEMTKAGVKNISINGCG